MLKFSGFADLTSCLEEKPHQRLKVGEKNLQQRANTEKAEMLFKLLAAEVPIHCMRQRQQLSGALTHKHSH